MSWYKTAVYFTADEARRIGERIGIDWDTAKFTVEEFKRGLRVEMEHGTRDPRTNVTGNNREKTGKIAWAHLLEDPKYYTKLRRIHPD